VHDLPSTSDAQRSTFPEIWARGIKEVGEGS
jgi:hypothetical protein